MSIKDILDIPAVYLLWQAPFVAQKMAPVVGSDSFRRARSVLDVGCGPGTNTRSFNGVPEYLGVDLDERYVAYARKRHGREFRVRGCDIGHPEFVQVRPHLDEQPHASPRRRGGRSPLGSLPRLLADDGEIHILDLVLADEGLPRKLALADQGEFPRSVPEWRSLVSNTLEIRDISPFNLTLGGVELWEMVHISAG